MLHTLMQKRLLAVVPQSHTIGKQFFSYKSMRLVRSLSRQAYRDLGNLLPLAVLTGGLLVGCGYTVVGAPSGSSASRITLAVLSFTNQTHEPGLESHLTTALRHAILRNQAFRLASENTSQLRLSGVIRRVRLLPLSFDMSDNVLQYRIEVDVQIRLRDGTAQLLTLEQEIPAWAEYLVSSTGNVRENVVAKEAAIFRLAQQFAGKCTALLAITLL